MESLLPDRLKELWGRVDAGHLTADAAQQQQEVLLGDYRAIWTKALVREDGGDLKQSLLHELAGYLNWDDLDEIEARCRVIVQELKGDWERIVKRDDPLSIERFYDQSQAHLFELTWWHTLAEDPTPLAYVLALDFARRRPVVGILISALESDPARSSLPSMASRWRSPTSARRYCDLLNGDSPSEG